MFDIRIRDDGVVAVSGRLDAAQAEKADEVLKTIENTVVIDFQELDYISSAGIGVLLTALKRLTDKGETMKLQGMNKHVRNVFQYSGLHNIFEIL